MALCCMCQILTFPFLFQTLWEHQYDSSQSLTNNHSDSEIANFFKVAKWIGGATDGYMYMGISVGLKWYPWWCNIKFKLTVMVLEVVRNEGHFIPLQFFLHGQTVNDMEVLGTMYKILEQKGGFVKDSTASHVLRIAKNFQSYHSQRYDSLN